MKRAAKIAKYFFFCIPFLLFIWLYSYATQNIILEKIEYMGVLTPPADHAIQL